MIGRLENGIRGRGGRPGDSEKQLDILNALPYLFDSPFIKGSRHLA
jgi:hypothetical protein